MREVLGSYRNGNYNVVLYNDGTKIRYNTENYMDAAFPESIDCKISNRCDMGCPMCHECSTPTGSLANLSHPIFDSLHPYTELALGGGNIFEHSGLDSFLFRMAAKKVVCNITLHALHYAKHIDDLQYYVDHSLIHGIGVSVNEPIDEAFLTYLKRFPNVVVHVIAGVVPWETIDKLANNNIKLLILGYKTYGRGMSYVETHNEIWGNIEKLSNRLPYLMEHFPVVSFDNLALEQLKIKNFVDEDTWKVGYMGDDGTHTMYLDMVEEKYAVSSVSARKPIFSNDIKDLFAEVKNV